MPCTRYRILLAEDNRPDVFLIREALRSAKIDFDLTICEDGEKAIESLDRLDQGGTETYPHLILLDLNLPKKGGEQILGRVRAIPALEKIPVLILTSSDSPKDRAEATRLGAAAYFRKPSDLEEFMRLGPLARSLLTVS